jgi:hypothetical protein
MNRLACLATVAALAASADALALGSLASVNVIDRDSGNVLSTHYYRGEYWVAGTPGARYSIEIRNRSGGRLLAVTSVDGVNVISGATAGWDQGGYVFDPGEQYQITGWRKSNDEVAAFTFTDSPNSYAARTGRAGSIGVIGVAVFRERAQRPPKIASVASEPQAPPAGAAQAQRGESRNAAGAAADQAAVAEGGRSLEEVVVAPIAAAPLAPQSKLGTGHGAREYSYVQDTQFQRLQSEPNEIIRIRYDSLDNLIAMGIVRRPRPNLPGPDPFPGSQPREFVPDPPG